MKNIKGDRPSSIRNMRTPIQMLQNTTEHTDAKSKLRCFYIFRLH